MRSRHTASFNSERDIAELADPAGLMQGTGRLMRHVKLTPGSPVDAWALAALITVAYQDMKTRAMHE